MAQEIRHFVLEGAHLILSGHDPQIEHFVQRCEWRDGRLFHVRPFPEEAEGLPGYVIQNDIVRRTRLLPIVNLVLEDRRASTKEGFSYRDSGKVGANEEVDAESLVTPAQPTLVDLSDIEKANVRLPEISWCLGIHAVLATKGVDASRAQRSHAVRYIRDLAWPVNSCQVETLTQNRPRRIALW